MKLVSLLRLSITGCVIACMVALNAHEIPVHQKITEHVFDSAVFYSSAVSGFLTTIASDCNQGRAQQILIFGSHSEDYIFSEDPVGGNRSANHFYDPLTQLGIRDFPFVPEPEPYGKDSFTWASTRDCPCHPTSTLGLECLSNVDKVNKWSWQNARDYEWDGLTAENSTTRFQELTNMFRALGQVIHLLEDASQPQHVRDEQHLPRTPCLKNPFVPWGSPIEFCGAYLIMRPFFGKNG